jgi:nucleoside-diphosphate-sugar epimerase
MAKILVTGGAGFIGSNLVDKLIELNHHVVVLDDLSSGLKENVNQQAEFHKVDICDWESMSLLFKGIDFVIHLAAIPRVPVSVVDPIGTSRVNIMGTLNVFKAAQEAKVKRVVFASSSAVYGEQDKMPLVETMIPDPISPYGLQKLSGEQWAKMFSELYYLPVVCLRYFNVYGPRIDFSSDYSLVLGKFLKQRSQNEPLTIFGDGNQTRAFCFVSDVVEANVNAMESSKIKGGEVINIGAETSQSINYLADLIGGEKKYLSQRTGDMLHTQADTRKAKELLGWEPKISLEEGVEITKKWFEKSIK